MGLREDCGGHGPEAHGLGEVAGPGGGHQQQQQQQQQHQHQQPGEATPPQGPETPPKAPKKRPHHFESRDEEPPPPPQGQQGKPKAKAKPQAKGSSPKPQAPPLQERGRNPYGNVPGVGDDRYVPWREGGNGGTVSQVTVLRDWDEELDPGELWVVSQRSNGEGEEGKMGKKGKNRKREKERVPSGCRESFSSAPGWKWKPTSGGPWGPGTTGMTVMTRGTRVMTRGRGVTRGVRSGVTWGVRRKETRGLGSRTGVPGARMSLGNPAPRRRGNLRVATREWGPGGQGG